VSGWRRGSAQACLTLLQVKWIGHSTAHARRWVLATMAIALLLGALVNTVALAGGGRTGAVVFTVTLTGSVDPDDAFGVWRAKDECCFTDTVVLVCGAPPGSEPCRSGSYQVRVGGQPLGTEISYQLVRWPDGVANGDLSQGDEPQFMLDGTVVVGKTTSHIHLTYAYPTSGALPNTTIPAPK
jgi:hypothetical protein